MLIIKFNPDFIQSVSVILFILIPPVVYYFFAIKFFSPLDEILDSITEIQKDLKRKSDLNENSDWGILAEKLNNLFDRFGEDILKIKLLGKTRNQFLENVSHELKTPIFTLKGFVETLLDGAINDEKVNRTFLEKIQIQANRLENLFNDLIQISRIESGELKLEFSWFNYNIVIQELIDAFKPLADSKGLKIVVPSLVNFDVYGDAFRLQTVLSNLISNAINYSDKGSIIISVKKQNKHLITKITDTGIGIPAEKINHIFERFYRVDADRSRKSGGSGLGLAIVKHILEAHDCSIEIDSRIGAGTTISFGLKCRRIESKEENFHSS